VKLFLSQSMLESWAAADQADLRDGHLWMAQNDQTYPLTPAVHFRSLASGSDERKLLSKVKTEDQLKALGAEHLMDSVLLGDTAYEVTNGYVALIGAVPPKAGDSELLAKFLLEKLT
jgi:hypothetical protein